MVGEVFPDADIIKANSDVIQKFHDEHPEAPAAMLIRIPAGAELRTIDVDKQLQVVLWEETSKLPVRGSAGAAGYDLFSNEDTEIPPGGRAGVYTGISIKTPPNTYARIAPRQGACAPKVGDRMRGEGGGCPAGEHKKICESF